jgi:phosphate transport system permease protein
MTDGAPAAGSSPPRLDAAALAPRRTAERLIERVLLLAALLAVLTTVAMVAVLAFETLSFFGSTSVRELVADREWTPHTPETHFGVWPLLGGTLLTAGIAVLVATPIGVFGALFLGEFASRRFRALAKPMVELLAGIPTVVYGYFALVVVTPALQGLLPGVADFNALAAGLVVGLMILPTLMTLCDDAIVAVPRRVRDSAHALGVDRLAMVFRVVLPAARPGVTAAVMLAMCRAIGETMIVSIAGGHEPTLTLDPRVPIETMTAYIVRVSTGEVPMGSVEYRSAFAVAFLLFAITIAMSSLAERLRRRLRKASP